MPAPERPPMTDAPLETLDPTLSHTRGETDTPLLEQTIGDNLDATVRALRRPRGARRRGAGHPLDVCRAAAPTSTGSPARCSPSGVDEGRPGRHLGAELRASGRSCSTRRPRSARSWSTSTRATARTSCSTSSTRPASRYLFAGRVVQDQRLRGDGRRGARRVPGAASTGSYFGTDGVGGPARPGRARSARSELARHTGGARRTPTRSTSSTPRAPPDSPRARRSATATSSTTATSSASCALHRGRPGLHPGALLPLLRHGHGQPRVHDPRRRAWSSRRPGSTRPRPCRPRQDEKVHLALRRADDVHRGVVAARLRRLRPVDGAHRHHGRIALSRRR